MSRYCEIGTSCTHYITAIAEIEADYAQQYVIDTSIYFDAENQALEEYETVIETETKDYAQYVSTLDTMLLASLNESVNCFDTEGCDWDHISVAQQNFLTGATLILMADGTLKRADELVVGDRVLSVPHGDPDGTPTECVITEIEAGTAQSTWQLTFINGDNETLELSLAEGHPLWVEEKGWTDVANLEQGDTCVTPDGMVFTLQEKILVDSPALTYNITVEGNHSFYVGDENGVILVHNDCLICQGKRVLTKPIPIITGNPEHTSHYALAAYSVTPCPDCNASLVFRGTWSEQDREKILQAVDTIRARIPELIAEALAVKDKLKPSDYATIQPQIDQYVTVLRGVKDISEGIDPLSIRQKPMEPNDATSEDAVFAKYWWYYGRMAL